MEDLACWGVLVGQRVAREQLAGEFLPIEPLRTEGQDAANLPTRIGDLSNQRC